MAETAYEMLNRAEEMVGSTFPFAWLLFRPPWSSQVCSKALIFRKMKEQAEQNVDVWTKKYCGIMFCVAKTLSLQQSPEEKAEAEKWFGMAASKGCGDAAYELYQLRRANAVSFDVGARTENIRYLRGFEGSQSWNVEVSLCTEYARGNYAGKGAKAAQHYFQQKVMLNSQLTAAHLTESPDLDKDGKMRYILVDWLVEVADLKTFSRETLYMTVGLVDRYLEKYEVTRKTLQLLGISCMVIAARFTESEVITIREAAWLTDNTYKYEQVVRTMGSALCAAGGKLRVPTTLDFLQLYAALENIPKQREEVLHYVSELALLNIPVGQIPPGLMAAAMVFLAGAGMKLPDADCWPDKLALWSGLRLEDVATVIRRVTAECFRTDEVKDHRDEKLKAVADRYQRHTGHSLEESGFTPASTDELEGILRRLGVDVVDGMDVNAGMLLGGGAAAAAAAVVPAQAAVQGMDFECDAASAGMDVDATQAQTRRERHLQSLSNIGNTLVPGVVPLAGAKRAESADTARQQVTPTEGDFASFGN